jgi:hypothetical protein
MEEELVRLSNASKCPILSTEEIDHLTLVTQLPREQLQSDLGYVFYRRSQQCRSHQEHA